ncbi:hypothetical protein AB1N83_010855 [Pleurotus pulmonarius]
MQSNGNIVVLVLGASGSGKSLFIREATNDETVVVGEEGTMESVTQNVKSSVMTTRASLIFIDTPAPANDRLLDAGLINAISDELGQQLKGDGRIGCVVYCLTQAGPLHRQHVVNGLLDVSRLTVKHPKLRDAALIFAAMRREKEELKPISWKTILKERGVELVSGSPCTDIDNLKNLVLEQCDTSKPPLPVNKHCWFNRFWLRNRGRNDM